MLTTTSNIIAISGYQDQQNVFTKVASNVTSKNDDPSKNQNDEVSLSQEARDLQQTYKKKETVLEQNYTQETQLLEREFIQARNRLEAEHSQKKRVLNINLYA